MLLNPKKSPATNDYPSTDEYRLGRRSFLRALGGAALSVTAGALLAKDATTEAKPTKTLAEQVKELAADLGSDDFKVRRKATAALIAMGKGNGKDKTADAKVKATVLAALGPLKQAKDPEVAQRAKTIVAALTPKPAPPRPPRVMKGIVRQVKGGR